MEFINNLKYDIFLVYSGIILLGGSGWVYYIFNKNMIENLMTLNIMHILLYVVMWIGVYLLSSGLGEFRGNYLKEKEITNLKNEVEKLVIQITKNLGLLFHKKY